MIDFLSQAFITLLVIVDPFLIIPIFISMTYDYSALQRKNISLKTCIIATILLVSFGLVGDGLLDIIGISQPAFSIAGGFLLLLSGMERLMAKPTLSKENREDASEHDDIAVFPLAIPLIAGPGAMTSIVVLMREADSIGVAAEAGVVLMALLVLLITYFALQLAEPLMRIMGATGMNVLTRVFGVIVAALATQLIVNGITAVVKGIR